MGVLNKMMIAVKKLYSHTELIEVRIQDRQINNERTGKTNQPTENRTDKQGTGQTDGGQERQTDR